MPAATVSTTGNGFDRSLAQRRQALIEANRIRTARKQIKADLKAGEITWREVFVDPDVSTMKVFDLLTAFPHIGVHKASVLLRTYGISHSKTVGGMSSRQRDALTARLELGAPFSPMFGSH